MSRRRVFQMLVVVFAAICVLMFSGLLRAQGNSDDAFERVKQVQERHTEKLMAQEGVVGTAIGLNQHGRHAVMVLLEEPGLGAIPQQLEGVPVHPVVTGKIYALVKPEKPGKPTPPPDPDPEPTAPDGPPDRYFPRPVPIGVSTGYPEYCIAGTIGCRVTNGTNVYALSNNHVYAMENDKAIGSRLIQPGLVDAMTQCVDDSQYDFGALYDFQPIDFAGAYNTIDAAIALVPAGNLSRFTPADGYGTPKSATAKARLFMSVKKYGRTTSLTRGYIAGVNVTIQVLYGDDRVALFKNQIAIGSGGFSSAGDSGSLIVVDGGRDDRKAVGLLFAGGSDWTFANPITSVLDHFGVTIDGE